MLLLISLIDVVLSKGKRRVGAGKESLFLGIFLGMADLAAVGIFFVDLPYKWRSTKNIGNSINVDNLLYLPIHDIDKCGYPCSSCTKHKPDGKKQYHSAFNYRTKNPSASSSP